MKGLPKIFTAVILSLIIIMLVYAETAAEGTDLLEKLETGDVLIFRAEEEDWFYQLIRNTLGCQFSHVALYWGRGFIVESAESGVQLSSLSDLSDNAKKMMKILRYPELTEEQKKAIQNETIDRIGTPYPNIRALAEIGMVFTKFITIENPLLQIIARPFLSIILFLSGENGENYAFLGLQSSDGPRTLTCTEFVFLVLKNAGVPLELTFSPDFLLPDDFFYFSCLKEVE